MNDEMRHLIYLIEKAELDAELDSLEEINLKQLAAVGLAAMATLSPLDMKADSDITLQQAQQQLKQIEQSYDVDDRSESIGELNELIKSTNVTQADIDKINKGIKNIKAQPDVVDGVAKFSGDMGWHPYEAGLSSEEANLLKKLKTYMVTVAGKTDMSGTATAVATFAEIMKKSNPDSDYFKDTRLVLAQAKLDKQANLDNILNQID